MITRKNIILTLLFLAFFAVSCKTKKECPSFEEPSSKKEEKSDTKYKLILLKDGQKVKVSDKKRNKKAKQKLFKKRVLK